MAGASNRKPNDDADETADFQRGLPDFRIILARENKPDARIVLL